MPSSSQKQHNFMGMIKHSPEMAKKAGVPQSVGADFIAADKKAGKFKNPEHQKTAASRIRGSISQTGSGSVGSAS